MTPPPALTTRDPSAQACEACDLLVIGSGAGGLSAAVTAAHLGLKVAVLDKHGRLGGTTAWSGGWMWIPRNPLARAAGIDEDPAEPRRYLQSILGDRYDAARIDSFLAHGPAMLQFHLDHTALRFVDGNAVPDFHGRQPGARTGGRSVCAAPYDGRALGVGPLRRLRDPLDLTTFVGMSIGADLRHFMRASRHLEAFRYVAGRLWRHGVDLLRFGTGTLRMGGNALAAALLKSADDLGVRCLTGHAAERLIVEDGRVVGAWVRTADGVRPWRAKAGVVLAAGGFPHDPARQAQWFGHADHHSAAPPENTGDGLRLGEAAGAALSVGAAAGAWAPVSLVPRAGGRVTAFPHLVERGKPGLIAVDADGERFVDEAGDYHSFMRALFERCAQRRPGQPVQAWLLCDHRFQRRYGLGASRPFPLPLRPWLRGGYLRRAATLDALARDCGIDPAGLQRTVTRLNADAVRGEDTAFGRGSVPYERLQGDPEHPGPNPCVAPIEHGPFYAVRIVPGSLGTFAGLAGDAHARVLDAQGRPIPGLYAAGNDLASVMAGHYPSGGITLGPAMTFGYVLAHHAAGRPLPMPMPMPASSNVPSHTDLAA
jgi:succinate dehydrogenase/fumarate reductase flavoprotein subunit